MQHVCFKFAISIRDYAARRRILEAAGAFTKVGAKLEPPSNLIAMQIASVPVILHTLDGRIDNFAEMITEEKLE